MKSKLTLKKMTEMYNEARKYNQDFTIPRWKMPFLWLLWFFAGYTITSENWKSYWIDFRGTKYLLKSDELSK